MSHTYTPLLAPEAPLMGMRSYPPPAALMPGEAAQLTNVRLGEGLPRVRWGIAKAGSSPVVNPLHATGYCIGASSITCNGVYYAVSCWSSTGGSTAAHFYAYNLSTGAWTEWTTTDTASKYGSSTPASFDVGRPWWVVVRDPVLGAERVVCSSGVGFPLVVNPAASGGVDAPYAVTHQPISPPSTANLFATTPTFPVFFTVNDESTTTLSTGTASRFVAADQGTSPENYIRVTRDTTASTDPTRVIQFGTAKDLSDCYQLVFLHDTKIWYWWDLVKLEISENGSDWSTVWDPENPTGKVVASADSQTTRVLTAFPLTHIAAGSRDAIAYFRLTYLGGTPASDHTFDIFGIFGSGKINGQSFHAVEYVNSGSRAGSIALLCQNVLPEYVKNLGCPTLDNSRLPNHPDIFYSYEVSVQNTDATEMGRGVDALRVYRNDPGDPDGRFTYVTAQTLAAWTPGSPGSWAFSSGSALSQISFSDNTPYSTKNERVVAPDASTQPVPGGVCATTIGSRLVIGIGISSGGQVWFSEEYNPFRFRKRQINETSGTTRDLMSGEVPMNFADAPVSPVGTESKFLVTNKSVYLFGGRTSTTLGSFRHLLSRGTYYPQSVASEREDLYFLDTSKQVVRYNGRLELLSEYRIEDKFSALDATISTGQYEADGIFCNLRYYLTYATTLSTTPTDRRKATPMLWETRRDVRSGREFGWMQDDPVGTTITAEWFFKKDEQLYAIGSDMFVYAWDLPNQTTDSGTGFTATITWGLIYEQMRMPFTVRHIAVMCDDASSGSVAWTRTYRPSGETQTSSATLDVATTQQWTEDSRPAIGSTGEAHGVACQISGVFTVPGGTRIYAVQYEHEPVLMTPKATA